MNDIDGARSKNPFSVSPYRHQRRYDAKYIPESIAIQLDTAFKNDEIALYLRCVYWLLRLIPSRIGEILGMKIDCLKRFNGQYVLFIPTWKQNGGWQQPAIRSIHLEDKGIAGYLIGLIKEQQETARQIQKFLPEDKKGMLFSYRQSYCRKGKPTYSTKLCFVASIFTVNDHFRKICRRYNISDETGNVYVVTTHQFRHNGITDRLAAGFTAAQIAEMTGHHGDAMIFNAYAHLNLMPETIREKQNYVLAERQESDKRYVLFGGRILNMDEQVEQRLMKTSEPIASVGVYAAILQLAKVICGIALNVRHLWPIQNKQNTIANRQLFGVKNKYVFRHFQSFVKMRKEMRACLNPY